MVFLRESMVFGPHVFDSGQKPFKPIQIDNISVVYIICIRWRIISILPVPSNTSTTFSFACSRSIAWWKWAKKNLVSRAVSFIKIGEMIFFYLKKCVEVVWHCFFRLRVLLLSFLPIPNKRGQMKTAASKPIDGTSNGIIQAL